MTTTAFNALYRRHLVTIIFIAINALPISATAQNIYKCGNTYGQSPCPGGRALTVEDPRNPAQKQQSDEATQRDVKLARVLEKERITQETTTPGPPPAPVKAAKATNSGMGNGVVHKITPKRTKTRIKKPEAFVAEIPGPATTPALKKATKKKPATPA